MKTLDIDLDIWQWSGVVVVGGNQRDFGSFLACNFDIQHFEPDDICHGNAIILDAKPWIIWLETLDNHAILAHEAFHIAAGVMRQRGLSHSIESEEAYAYTLGYIVDRVLTAKAREWKRVKLIN